MTHNEQIERLNAVHKKLVKEFDGQTSGITLSEWFSGVNHLLIAVSYIDFQLCLDLVREVAAKTDEELEFAIREQFKLKLKQMLEVLEKGRY